MEGGREVGDGEGKDGGTAGGWGLRGGRSQDGGSAGRAGDRAGKEQSVAGTIASKSDRFS